MALGLVKAGTALVLALVAALVLVHPDVDLREGTVHSGYELHQVLIVAIPAVLGGPSVVAATATLDTTPISAVFRPGSLDLLCVRLC
jgi:hypothetical protein